MWVVSNGKELLLIDAGLKFPSDDMYGVNFLLPKIDYIVTHQEKIAGIVLTHAHEDHVGGLVPLLEELDDPPPIYATELTLGLLEERITDVEEVYEKLLIPVKGREKLQIGSFEVEFLHVCHSISGALGLAIQTDKGAIVFTGDFKMDPTPIDQQPTDYYKFAELGEKGVLALVSDSTNATRPGYTPSEKEVAQNFVNAFYRAKGRIIIATFASSLHRIQQIINRCSEFERKIAFIGRSMERMTTKAMELGYLNCADDLIIKAEQIDNYPPEKIVIVTTGSQGEPTAALSLMASGRYRQISVVEGDTIILSANRIPGNERSIFQNVDRLMEKGAQVLYETRKGLHASGHASQEELKLMLNLTRPQYFIPTHGEYRQMQGHAELAYITGIAKENVFLMAIGDRLELTEEGTKLGTPVPSGEIMVAGRGLGYLDQKELKERHKMVKDGVVFASCSYNGNGELSTRPRISSRGFIVEDDPEELYQESAKFLEQQWEKKIYAADKNVEQLENRLSETLGRFIYAKTRRRPVIIPLLQNVGDQENV